MVLNVINNPYHYELQKLTSAFFPSEPVEVHTEPPFENGEGTTVTVSLENLSETNSVIVSIRYYNSETKREAVKTREFPRFTGNDDNLTVSLADSENSLELKTAQMLYSLLSEVLSVSLSWGILTGIRPSKLLIRLMNEKGRNEGIEYFKNCFFVSDKKTSLALSVADAEEKIINTSTPNSFSLYISIPFCPTRCSYCSFVSSSVNKESARQIIPVYFENLLKEIEYTGKLVNKLGIDMLSAYVGGGTPSILSAEQITRLLKMVNSSFDFSKCGEFTFEAGRPDTITTEKLIAAKENGIDRISINPQTMNDEILRGVGRTHSAQDIFTAYSAAEEVGFKNINMDLIAGLPGDTATGFADTLEKLVSLDPASITVHTLAYKRSSDLDYRNGLFADDSETKQMVYHSYDRLVKCGYIPYYMYRQAKSVGNLENVGYAKPGFESAYNIYMMEECHSILACGAGAVTKIKNPSDNNITRVYNFKYPYEYNSRFDEQINRKRTVSDYYG